MKLPANQSWTGAIRIIGYGKRLLDSKLLSSFLLKTKWVPQPRGGPQPSGWIWRWGLSTQGVLWLKPCDWKDAGRGTVQILSNGQNPGTVLSDVGAGLEAPAIARLGWGGWAAGTGEGQGGLQGVRGHWCGWEISYLPTRAKIKFGESAWGAGQTGYSRLPLGRSSHLCKRDIA